MREPDRPALEVTDLVKRYPTGTEALKEVSLTIEGGDFFGLLGPNGAGKSTLIHCTTGLARPSSGQIRIFGHDAVHHYREARQAVGLASQELNLDFFLTVAETLDYHGGYFGMSRRDRRARADELLEAFSLTDKRDERTRFLSGGMKRRITLARALMLAGEPLGVTPYGLEALSILRIEKGHASGGELNGQVTAGDLGLGGLMSRQKDFIGRVLAMRPGLTDPDRPTLVGVRAETPSQRFGTGAHLLARDAAATPEADEGYVTSTAWSPAVGGWIGLALLRRGAQRYGEGVRAYDPVRGADTPVQVCPPVFVDPHGERLGG